MAEVYNPSPHHPELSTRIARRFEEAVAFVSEGKASSLTQTVQLQLYALFKRVTSGGPPDVASKPSAWDISGTAKWNAWNALGDIATVEAKKQYAAILTLALPHWNTSDSSGGDGDGDDGAVSAFNSQRRDQKQAESTIHTFWDEQPIFNRFGADSLTDAPLEMVDGTILEDANVETEPFPLPPGLHWCDYSDVSVDAIAQQVYILYSEQLEDDGSFSFNLSSSFLSWSMQPPAMHKDWFVGFHDGSRLLGFVCALPFQCSIQGKTVAVMEVKNLFVHPSMRGKRLAPVLISEVSRQCRRHRKGVALYTSSVTITRPITKCTFYQRPLNVPRLITAQFQTLPRHQTLPRYHAKFAVSRHPSSDIRPMSETDVAEALRLLQCHLQTFDVYQVFSEQEFRYWFTSEPEVVKAYVVEREGELIGFASFVVLEAPITSNSGSPMCLRGAFLHYCAVREGCLTLEELMNDLLHMARYDASCDVLMALNSSGFEDVVEDPEFKFIATDEYMLYHLYNFRCFPVPSNRFNVNFL